MFLKTIALVLQFVVGIVHQVVSSVKMKTSAFNVSLDFIEQMRVNASNAKSRVVLNVRLMELTA